MTMSGGCLCGGIRYAIEGDPMFVGNCYCIDCQKESGTGHITSLGVSDGAIAITGEPRSFVKTADSGHEVQRLFCPACGTTLLGRPGAIPGLSVVRAGTLDDSSALQVGVAVYSVSARPWDQPPAGVHSFAGMPPNPPQPA